MVLITSAAYVTSDLQTEFGRIPSAFLPLQNRRLFEYQSALFSSESIFLSLPEGFQLPVWDQKKLKRENIEIIWVPENLSLGESVLHCIKGMTVNNGSLKILHGDTLFKEIPGTLDTYSVATTNDNYSWATTDESGSEKTVYTGFFSFSSTVDFMRALEVEHLLFIPAIHRYAHTHPVHHSPLREWLDFGHANTFYRSKMQFTTERAFNNLIIRDGSVWKYSADVNKILAEADWFDNLPVRLKKYAPVVMDSGISKSRGFYEIEYFYLSSLSDLFVFGRNAAFVWSRIFNACNEFLSECVNYKPPVNQQLHIRQQADRLFAEKTLQRLTTYAKNNDVDLKKPWIVNGVQVPSITEILDQIAATLPEPTLDDISIIHGDFGFSNILYDFRSQNIKVIDPRGIDVDGERMIYGDLRYDIAKLGHSVIGMYDFIVAGHYTLEKISENCVRFDLPLSPELKEIQAAFLHTAFAGRTPENAGMYEIMIYLFLSMLPLHHDNPQRQYAMLVNALRIYKDFLMESP